MFTPQHNSIVKCTGEDDQFCEELQEEDDEYPCDASHNFECQLQLNYADGSEYAGVFVVERLKLPTQDNRNVNAHGVFG